jgi:DNA-directed RNA polymerase specialized sigma24 family protein
LREAADTLQAVPRQAKWYRALYHTYFQPAPSQEKAAELLDVPFSTFRRHLQSGIARMTEILWHWESGGLEK